MEREAQNQVTKWASKKRKRKAHFSFVIFHLSFVIATGPWVALPMTQEKLMKNEK
jgi:hypothetical protein